MVKVHIRVRPLSAEEKEEGHTIHDFDIGTENGAGGTEAQDHRDTSVLTSMTLALKGKRYEGFATVVGETENNRSTYVRAVQPLIASVLQGNTVCCFCYGHTNSGKTHTIIGYGMELGMYEHAAEELFQAIDNYKSEGPNSEQLLIQVRFAELYNGRVYDLLDERKECHVREDSASNIHIRSATQIGPQGQVLVQSLRAEYAHNLKEVIAIVSRAMDIRATGTSELHDQSSRSHAVLELEIVTPLLSECRQKVVIAESEIVPIGKQRDGMYIQVQMKCVEKRPDGKYITKPNGASAEEQAELQRLNEEVGMAQGFIDNAQEEVSQAMKVGPPCIGGKFVFVDLAGAEFTGEGKYRTPGEKKEAREINTSLLALKECIRSQHAKLGHIPFRNSKLTMLLKPYLDSKEVSTVMIANVSASTTHLTKTINTVQYASLVSSASMA